MKISLNWLKSYIKDLEIDLAGAEELAHRLAVLGFEAESVEKIANTFQKLVVGKVIEKEDHPDSDHLSLCKVRVSDDEVLQIVCGAPNVAKGQTVPVALVGAVFGDFKIKKGKIRGVESFGMICAGDELGLSDDHDGIMVLDDKYEAGTPLKELFGFEDIVFDIEVTSNRPDVMGYLGFAREFAFLTGHKVEKPEFTIKNTSDDIKKYITVTVEDEKACPRYAARMVKNVKVQESPQWLKEKLISVGLRPINNIVDITNFVMMESGHPLHAFDYSNIENNEIVVRKAQNGEKFTTLDEVEHTLNDEILLICDGEKPVALAGVMGGLNSGVTVETKDVLLEVAYFNLADIRHATKHLNIFTDSSKRFERGVDPNDMEFVINRAAALIEELADGEVVAGICDVYENRIEEKEVELRFERTDKILGFKVDPKDIVKNFEAIDLKCEKIDENRIKVTVPTCRPDITSEIDLIEEVVRLYGYDKIPSLSRSNISLEGVVNKEEADLSRIRKEFVNLGLMEVSAKSMVDGKYTVPFNGKAVKIEHPLNEEMNHLRNSLLISLLHIAGRNIRRNNDSINIFEAGRRFELLESNDIKEENSVAVLLTGILRNQAWNETEVKYDFYDIKGLIEQLMEDRCYSNYSFEAKEIPSYFDQNESLSLFCLGKYIGTFGRIADETMELFDLEQDIYCFEAALQNFDELELKNRFKLKTLSKYPKVVKDLSILMNEEMSSEEVIKVIKKSGSKNLIKIEVLDFYQGKQLEEGQKSYSYRMTFQSPDKTLKDKEIDKLFNKVINSVTKQLGVSLR